jgi:hypothetical protein
VFFKVVMNVKDADICRFWHNFLIAMCIFFHRNQFLTVRQALSLSLALN